jgi:uncharacterized protein (DUF1684 family)
MTAKPKTLVTVLLLGAALAGGSILQAADAVAAKPAADAYRKEIEAWRQKRVEGLKREDGWLTLVGLYWLQPGENSLGSDPGSRVVLPAGKSPARAGTLVREGDKVTLRVEPGVPLTANGKPVAAPLELAADATGKPTELQLGSLNFYTIKRGDRIGVRIKDKESPGRTAFKGLDDYPIRPEWRVVARFEPYNPPKQVPITNVLGQVENNPSPGAVVFDWQGKTYRMDALGDLEEGLSLIFGDATNGKETYGAGRFLDTDPPKDGKVVVDFNTAYNPPCAFTAFATCPLPPPQNKLAIAVTAGEKKYAGGPEH